MTSPNPSIKSDPRECPDCGCFKEYHPIPPTPAGFKGCDRFGKEPMTKTTIREEFEEAWRDMPGTPVQRSSPFENALWAVNWMAERCAKESQLHLNTTGSRIAESIRDMAKELS